MGKETTTKLRNFFWASLAISGCGTARGKVPLDLHQVMVVSPGTEIIIRFPRYDFDGKELTAKITSLPASGTLYQLSKVFSDYGYEPTAGERITRSGVEVTGSGNRVVYRRPRADAEARRMWGSTFAYTVEDRRASAENGTVTLVSEGRFILAEEFDTGSSAWQVCQSGGSKCEAARYDASSRGLLSFFVSGTDSIVYSNAEGVDNTLWWFKAGPMFSGNLGIAYDGTLEFSLGAFSGSFSEDHLNGDALHLVELHCSTCERNTGTTLGYPLAAAGGFTGDSVGVSYALPLSERKGWVKDPKNSLKKGTAPTKCEMIQVLSNLTWLRILGDFTKRHESVALDSVYVRLASRASGGGSNRALPLCAQGSPDAFVCTC